MNEHDVRWFLETIWNIPLRERYVHSDRFGLSAEAPLSIAKTDHRIGKTPAELRLREIERAALGRVLEVLRRRCLIRAPLKTPRALWFVR